MSVSEQTLKDYDLLREGDGRIELPDVALVVLRGDDRKGWLQGQATNDLRKLESGASSAFCMVSVSGQIVTICEAWALPSFIAITMPQSSLPAFIQRVEQMVILEDVLAEDVSSTHRLLSIQGPRASTHLNQLLSLPSLDAGLVQFEDVEIICCRSNRTGVGGWDLWIPTTASVAIARLESEFQTISSEAFEVARIESGIPKFGCDTSEKTFPPELGANFEARHVSYSKGCYVGQEVLMRIHSRGHTNKTWVGLVSELPIVVGAKVNHSNRSDVGVVTSSAFSPDFGYIGAAMIRNECAENGEVVKLVSDESAIEAEVRQMPILRLI